MTKNLIYALILLSVIISCSKEDEYRYATLTAELCDAHTSAAGMIDRATTDAGETLTFSPTANASWATTPDSIYRTLIYYNKVAERVKAVTPVGVESVLWLPPHKVKANHEWSSKADPVTLESSWMSANRQYINLRLSVKSGTPEAQKPEAQMFGLACDSIYSSDTGKRYACRLCHDQGDYPTYYSVPVYASIPIGDVTIGDTIEIAVTTWSGTITKRFIKK